MKTVLKSMCSICMGALAMAAFAQQPPADGAAEKQKRYSEALIQQTEMESKAQYTGDDEAIRRRLDLPPKLPPFERWNPPAAQTREPPQQPSSAAAIQPTQARPDSQPKAEP